MWTGRGAHAAIASSIEGAGNGPQEVSGRSHRHVLLTFAGCGSAVIAAAFPHVGIGLVGVSLAFGLTLLTMAYSIGHVSGCHINPAVTIGLAAGGRFPASQIWSYIVAQIVGAIIGSALLYVIARGAPDSPLPTDLRPTVTVSTPQVTTMYCPVSLPKS